MKCRRWPVIFLILLLFGCVKADKKRDFYYQSGCLYLKAQDFLLAEKEFRNAIQVDPEFSEGYRELCHLGIRSGQWQDALNFCLKIVKLNPDNDKDRQLLAQLYLINNNIILAKKLAGAGLERSPADPEWQFLSAMIFFKENQPEKAIAILKNMAEAPSASRYSPIAAYLTWKKECDLTLLKTYKDEFSLPVWAMTASALSCHQEEFSTYFELLREIFDANNIDAGLNELLDKKRTAESPAGLWGASEMPSSAERKSGIKHMVDSIFSSPLMIVVGSLMLALILFNRKRYKRNDP